MEEQYFNMEKNLTANTGSVFAPSRFAYIDIAKALGILMVVFAHINVEGGIYRTFYAFHIPLFFLLSGMTFRHEGISFKSFLGKKAKRLLLPYLAYSLITFVWYACVEVNMPEFNLTKTQSISGSFLEIFLARGSVDYIQHNPALWFIPCLFVAEVIYYLLCRCKKGVKLAGVIVLGAFGYICTLGFMPQLFRELPWQAEAAFSALPFIYVGELVKDKLTLDGLKDMVLNKKLFSWICVVVCFVAVVFLTKLNALFLPPEAKGHVSMGSNYLGNIVVFYVNALLGAFATIFLSALIADLIKERIDLGKSWLVWLGVNSYAVMAIHYPVKRRMVVIVAQAIDKWGLADVTGGFTVYTSTNLLASFIAFIFTMFITIVITIAADAFIKKAKLPGKNRI